MAPKAEYAFLAPQENVFEKQTVSVTGGKIIVVDQLDGDKFFQFSGLILRTVLRSLEQAPETVGEYRFLALGLSVLTSAEWIIQSELEVLKY